MNRTTTESNLGLRQQSEEPDIAAAANLETLSTGETQQLLRDLQRRQTELEAQNMELLRIQIDLETLKNRYMNFYDMAPIGYLTISGNGIIIEANHTAAYMLGVTRSDLLESPILQFVCHEDQDIYDLQQKRLIKTAKLLAWEMRLLKTDGSLLWANLSATTMQPSEYLMTMTDITEQKRTEKYVKMGRDILKILGEPGNFNDSIQRVLAVLKAQTGFNAVGIRLQKDSDYPYIAQEGFTDDFLFTENTLIDKDKNDAACRDKDGNLHLECTCGLVISGTADTDNPLFTQGGSFWTNCSFQLLDIPPDEDPRHNPRNQCIHQNYASVALIPIRDNDIIVGLIQLNDQRENCFTLETIELIEGIAANIGSSLMRKQAEKLLHNAYANLEKQVLERIADLSEINALMRQEMNEREQLEQQLLSAKRLEAIGQIAGGVAHEVRNPLNAILTITEALFREKEIATNPEYMPFIMHIRTQVNRLVLLMNDLLDLGRTIPATNLQPMPLFEICREALEIWKLTGMSKNKRCILTSDSDDITTQVLADSIKLQQVLFNLLENAGHHSADNSKIIMLLTHNSDNLADGMAVVQVIDMGTGIAEEKLPHVFDPFYTDRKGGTGLGLALVKHFVENMGGSVQIWNNKPPPGCTTEVRIPLFRMELS